jgi:hypothetical protein
LSFADGIPDAASNNRAEHAVFDATFSKDAALTLPGEAGAFLDQLDLLR